MNLGYVELKIANQWKKEKQYSDDHRFPENGCEKF